MAAEELSARACETPEDGSDVWADLLDASPSNGSLFGAFESSVDPKSHTRSQDRALHSAQVTQERPDVSRIADSWCQTLADLLGRENVSPDSDIFDDLGADSLLLAEFCTRLRESAYAFAPSMRDVYQHRSITALVTHMTSDELDTQNELPFVKQSTDHQPASRAMYLLVGVAQAVSLIGIAIAAGAATALGHSWTAAAEGAVATYQRSVAFGLLFLLGWAALPIAAKWTLVGTWKAQRFPLWSWRHFRFWLVTTLIKFSPMAIFVGSPIFLWWLRALGARIGRGVVYLSRQVPVCADQLTIGDGVVVRADAIIKCYRAVDRSIEIGPVHLGSNSFVGVGAVIDTNCWLGEGAQLGHASTLIPGQRVPDGAHVVGTPAVNATDFDYLDVEDAAVDPGANPQARRFGYSVAQLVVLFLVSLPATTMLPLALFRLPVAPTDLRSIEDAARLLLFAAMVYFGGIVALFVTAVFTCRICARAFEPGVAYPLYGWRYAVHRFVSRVTNAPVLTRLVGDTSYVLHYLYALGFGVKLTDQTGANFGTAIKHDSPYFVRVGAGTMVADGINFANTDYSSASFQVGEVRLAVQSYVGNNIVYPPQAKTSNNCLIGTKTMVPLDGEVRENTGLLGSPSFAIPRTVDRDVEFHADSNEELRAKLGDKDRHNRHSIALRLATRYIATLSGLGFVTYGVGWFADHGALVSALVVPAMVIVAWTFNISIERLLVRIQPLRPTICSMYELESWRVERFWKLNWNPAVLNGTAMKGMAWKLLGVDIGKQVFDDGCSITERTLASVGDYATLNSATALQCHSQEDAVYKADRIAVGRRCTLGTGAFVHYGTRVDDGTALMTNTFLMKGTSTGPGSIWGENPARELVRGTSEIEATIAPSTKGDTAVKPHTLPTADFQRWWHAIERAGLTPIGSMTTSPTDDVGQVEMGIEPSLAARIAAVADELGVEPRTLVFAAHARVVAGLTGETEVTLGYAPTGRPALPALVDLDAASWGSLIEQASVVTGTLDAEHERASDALADADFSATLFVTVFGSGEPLGSWEPGDSTTLRVSLLEQNGQLTLSMAYSLGTFDADAAKRILGYHIRSLEHLVADVDGDCLQINLLDDAEIEYQLNALAGPARELPDVRFHELFEQRVLEHPDRIAATHCGVALSYRELNSRANQLARALLHRGAKPEAVIGVVTERNLDWMASVIAIFKVGAAYLPIEPHFPADRIASMLRRSNCRLVISEIGSTATLYEAMADLPRVKGFFAQTAFSECRSDHNIDRSVHADQLAYIYFTSGSTGEPKGAMCEHLGMLNHLFAKIDDFGIAEGEAVAQIAPQCFDISLWQLISALLVGGRTAIIDQDTLLDPERLIDEVLGQNIGVLQVVPSYLEVLLSHLESRPSSLGSLHCVSVTGEALSVELAKRWFRSQPGIKLANAYGLTETCDDTNHEVMAAAPTNGRVSLGRAVNNVSVRVVGPTLSLVPLGAPGEIVFSGMCVGRGYINDPDRTAAAFVADPLVEGETLYRSGDFGRWGPEGKLEFLGRRDAQVKIRGFRIEIGDVENALLRVDGVRQSAVVITSRADGVKQLVAFYSGDRLQPKRVQDQLRSALPEYMVPSVVFFEEELPLSDNGKVDRKVLRSLATDREVINLDFDPPVTTTEFWLAGLWAELLQIPVDQLGRRDHFFDRGANSLLAVELVTKLDRVVSLRDITRTPVLSELAELIDASADAAGESNGSRELLQSLTNTEGSLDRTLVCFPYAGGNAINYQAMASALGGTGLCVYAVDLPGHDVGATSEPFESLDNVVARVVDEIKELNLTNLLLWGHSSGSAFALDTAARLADEGIGVERVFVAAQVPGSVADRERHAASLDGKSDAEVARQLAEEGGYGELARLSDEQAELVGAAYKHDVRDAHRWFIDRLAAQQPAKLSTPVVAVVADDDSSLSDTGPEGWTQLVEDVEVLHLKQGGHYFLRTEPSDAAQAVLAYQQTPSIADGRKVHL